MRRLVTASLAVLLVIACTFSSAAWAAPAYTVELVQVVHRHGARSPLVSANETLICGTEFPCGYLNYPGQRMLLNLGTYLRQRYNEDPAVVTTPLFPSSSYNLSIAHTRSTDVLRTVQSAVGLLRGLFPNMSAFFPVVHTVESEEDILLRSSVVPIIRARYNYATQEVRNVSDPVLDQRLSFDKLRDIAAEVHLDGFCSNYTTRSRCAEKLCDVAHAYQSTGQLDATPLLRQHLDDLCAVTAASSYYYFGYNASNPTHQKQGAPYYHLARKLVDNMKLYQNPASTGTPTFKLYQYSAHDTTVAPLAASLGDNSQEAMLPPFGTAFIIELLTLTTTNVARPREWHVRVLRGHPGVTPASNYTFALRGFPLRCTDPSGAAYVATNSICPLSDFERFVSGTSPTSEKGTCYLDPALLGRMDCPVDAVGDNRSLSEDCLFYRKQCPAYACGTGYYLDAVDYACRRIKAGSNDASTTTEGTASSSARVVVVVLLLLGVGGAAAYYFVYWRRQRIRCVPIPHREVIELQKQ